jgi:hypothetical protein
MVLGQHRRLGVVQAGMGNARSTIPPRHDTGGPRGGHEKVLRAPRDRSSIQCVAVLVLRN